MSTERDLKAWMSMSGGRRQPVREIADVSPPHLVDPTNSHRSRTSLKGSLETERSVRQGPIDWKEFARGSLLLAVLGVTLWIEWYVIVSLARMISQFVG